MKRYITFLTFVSILVAIILILFGVIRMNEFKKYHHSIATNATSGVASEISRFVEEKKRLVNIFAIEQRSLINKLLFNPDDDYVYKEFSNKLNQYFPEHFTFTLANEQGIPRLEDFDGLIGEQCQSDLKLFSKSKQQETNIHPHPELYHFDIMTSFNTSREKGILFVSFNADILGHILANAEAPGHQVLLLNKDRQMLIEVTSAGARNKILREDYRLTKEEKNRILNTHEVTGTRWHTADLYNPRLFSVYRSQIIQQSVIFYLIYLIFAAIFLNRLNYMEKMRELAEEQKNEFLSVVSHELRTPLTSIHGALSLVSNDKLGHVDDKALKFVKIALSNSERLGFLVDDLLDVQKIESGLMEYYMMPTEINYLVESCVQSQNEFATKFNASFTIENNVGKALVYVDKQRMSQAIINLLSNAVKYGAEGDNIIVSLDKLDGQVRINITDHGKGIQEKDRSRIFDKFVQIDSSATRETGGTGLGLNIVKLIVEGHHGMVDFYCTSNSTTFFIELPIYKE